LLRLYDTLSASKRVFEPGGQVVKLYVCGLTPYDATHLGHAFTFVSFDVLIRLLQYLGHEVQYVQNVTDVDDPLFEKARELGVSHQVLAARETERFNADMRDLNVLPPNVQPRASREIPDMVEIVKRLLENGNAYQADGHVYYSIRTDPEYGKLFKGSRELMIELARQRGGNPDDPRRHDPLDFVLWRPAGEDEPRATSPWGAGLPGWHLECSAMSLKYLGAPLDIHGGGSDLIFPHHENEIAQSESATKVRPFARFWMHTGMVYLGGQKMSKSLGNMVFVRELVPEYGSDAVRLYLSGCHYRAELQHVPALLERASRLARALTQALMLPSESSSSGADLAEYRDRFIERMSDDLDTPGAIQVLRELGEGIQRRASMGGAVRDAQQLLCDLGAVLGLQLVA